MGHPDERDRVSEATRQAEHGEADRTPGPDREPTREEEAAADEDPTVPETVRAHHEEMTSRGAAAKGEGRVG